MKAQKLLLLLCFPFIGLAQTEKEISSTINDVTIFGIGAQVSRDASINLAFGVNNLVFTDVSPLLDEKSIQFKTKADITILSMKHELRYDANSEKTKQEIAAINAQLKSLGEEVEAKRSLLAISVNEEQVVLQNTDFDVWQGMSVTQLQQGVDFVKNRLTEIKQRKQKLRTEIDDLNIKRQKLINTLQEKRMAESKAKGVVLLKVKSDKVQSIKAQLSYVVADAGWEPYYDLRVEDVSKPMKIEYKAKVYQNTGEEWKGVNLTLSTGNPYEDGRLPELNTWYVNFVNQNYYPAQPTTNNPQISGTTGLIRGVVIDQKTGEAIPFANVVALNSKGELIEGCVSDMDGSFTLDLKTPATMLEATYLGYHKYNFSLTGREKFYTLKMNESSESLSEVVVVYEQPEIERMPERDLTMESPSMNIRGARSEGTVYYVDGVKMRGSVNVPQAAISQTEVVTGGLPAQYGSPSRGVYNDIMGDDKDEFKISQNPVNLKFEVDLPYDVPSDGQEYKVSIKEYEKEASYVYRAVPKLNEHAFLTASMVGWENMNLMNGFAGIYLEGTYLGETLLNVEQASDTLQVDLGKDENIVVVRKAMELKEANKVFSKNKEERFHYQIKVRNNKAAALTLEIIDQYPVSGNSSITVEKVESTGAKEEEKTGILTWEFTLQPKEEKTINLEYKIRYPSGKKVNSK